MARIPRVPRSDHCICLMFTVTSGKKKLAFLLVV